MIIHPFFFVVTTLRTVNLPVAETNEAAAPETSEPVAELESRESGSESTLNPTSHIASEVSPTASGPGASVSETRPTGSETSPTGTEVTPAGSETSASVSEPNPPDLHFSASTQKVKLRLVAAKKRSKNSFNRKQ